ncbi:uncharacterized protein LOC119643532 [Glossina fuscipes]|uniref:Uncharacterized protein LOC119643532 n=1 Tax=Glossina fuscipes TaxID=7396 RepID=A0A9C6E336_9MUSC|nr:uncharacterized protein LOC119643532 [Glossina fuscipes]
MVKGVPRHTQIHDSALTFPEDIRILVSLGEIIFIFIFLDFGLAFTAFGRDNTSQKATLTPMTRFDQQFQRLHLGRQNTAEECPTSSSSAGLFPSFAKKDRQKWPIPINN